MAFEMVTGRLPFEAGSVVEMLKAHVRTPAPDVTAIKPDVPESLALFIRGALVKKPQERLTDWTRIRALLEPRRATPEVASEAREEVVHIRYPEGAEARVQRAIAALEADLESSAGVEIKRASLEPSTRRAR
jgi:serine/threonine-protein kinase